MPKKGNQRRASLFCRGARLFSVEACTSSEENELLGHLGQFLGLGSLGYVFELGLF